MAERVEIALVPALGRTAAREAVAAASAESGARGRPLLDVLLERDDVRRSIEPAALAGLFDPAGYLGSAGAFIDRALVAHGARRPESV
jgi:3-carboxy-cis,cis-muconate cycloisomerase